MDPSRVRHVLVAPQSGGNVGATARAMKNLGYRRLVLVAPECDWLGKEARMFAVGAKNLLEEARIFPSLDEALTGCAHVVGTTRREGRQRRPHYRLDGFRDRWASLHDEVAVLFGREDHGMTDREIDRCTHLLHLPADPGYPSLNLAQAVLLVSYEMRLASGAAGEPDPQVDEPAPHQLREAMFAQLDHVLMRIGYLHADSREPIMRRIRRLFGRSGLAERDVALIRGMARQINWAADQAQLPEPPPLDAEESGK